MDTQVFVPCDALRHFDFKSERYGIFWNGLLGPSGPISNGVKSCSILNCPAMVACNAAIALCFKVTNVAMMMLPDFMPKIWTCMCTHNIDVEHYCQFPTAHCNNLSRTCCYIFTCNIPGEMDNIAALYCCCFVVVKLLGVYPNIVILKAYCITPAVQQRQ